MKEQRTWIPVSERLPNHTGRLVGKPKIQSGVHIQLPY